ncbi:sulfatase [Planctomycetota bacterium]
MKSGSEINRREFLRVVGVGAAAVALPNLSFAAKRLAKSKRPNFVFVFADDMGWGDLGCYGNPHIKTPNLDRLAKQGMLFTNFYVNASVCSPSRTAVMTGHFPARHGIHGYLADDQLNEVRGMPNWLDPKAHMLTRLLQHDGYSIGHFGKWHLGGSEGEEGYSIAPTPDKYGIDDYRVLVGNGNIWHNTEVDQWWSRSSQLFVDETIGFIEKNCDKPFYVNLWLLDPHTILDPTKEQMKPYSKFGPRGEAGKRYKGAQQVYYSVVTNADKQVGRLFNKLDELGLTDNTVVIFSSDNGPEDIAFYQIASHSGVGSPGPFRGRKRSIYEGGIRMPFIIRWPGGKVPAGKVDNSTVMSCVDLLPTICGIAGVKLPVDLKPDGEDMSAAFSGKPVRRSKPLMWEYLQGFHGHPWNRPPLLAIRDGKWKLLMNPDKSRIELYDLVADPRESDNLADQNQDVVNKLSAKLVKWTATLPKERVTHQDAGKNDYPWPK